MLGTVIWAVGYFLSSLSVCPAILSLPEEFLLKDQLLSLWESPCVFVVFPLLLLIFVLRVWSFVNLINMCLGVFRLGFILFGTLCVSWTWVIISFPILGKFSTIISSSIFSSSFFLSSSSGTPMIWMLGCLTLSWRSLRLSSFLLIHFYFFLSDSFNSTILSPTSLILSSAFIILLFVPSRVFFYLIYCIIHYILTLSYFF